MTTHKSNANLPPPVTILTAGIFLIFFAEYSYADSGNKRSAIVSPLLAEQAVVLSGASISSVKSNSIAANSNPIIQQPPAQPRNHGVGRAIRNGFTLYYERFKSGAFDAGKTVGSAAYRFFGNLF